MIVITYKWISKYEPSLIVGAYPIVSNLNFLQLYRIEKLSFGDDHAGIIQPLEGDEKLTDISELTFEKVKWLTPAFADLMNFQYFIEIVPTEVQTLTGKKVFLTLTFQICKNPSYFLI